jgi:hypothetical protein
MFAGITSHAKEIPEMGKLVDDWLIIMKRQY